jgi:hypothetical protein
MAKDGASSTKGMRSGGSVASVTHSLKGIGFPAKKADLLERAKKNHAERAVLDAIGGMPDQDYRTMADVMKGFGKAH